MTLGYLTITSTAPNASDLRSLLHKRPDRGQSFDMSGGVAHVFHEESSSQRCTVALLLDVDSTLCPPYGVADGLSVAVFTLYL